MQQGVPAADLAGGAVVAEPRFSPNGQRLAWLRATDGVTEILVTSALDPGATTLVATPEPLGGIGAYRGGVWAWVDDDRAVVATRAGGLLVLPVDGGPPAMLPDEGRASSPTADGGARILAAYGLGEAMDIVEVAGDGSPPRRWSLAEFAWDPATTADGRWIAWHEWDIAAMSWTASRIVVVDREDGVPRVVAGGADTSVGQPRFSPDGRRLAYVSDESGFWNVWVADADGASARRLVAEDHDHSEPAWGPGRE